MAFKQRLKQTLIDTARLSGLPRMLAPRFGGVGAILALHRVRAASTEPFQPNRTLEVTPDFLDRTLTHLGTLEIDIVSLDEAERRLNAGDFRRRFVCITLDDGYADNYLDALPVFKAHAAPFSIYLTTGFVDHHAFFWWMTLEEVIRDHDEVALDMGGESESLATRTLQEKERAFELLHGRFRILKADVVEAAARKLSEDYGIDNAALCSAHAMTWDMAREITEGGLGRIEAHTEKHLALSLQRPEDIQAEMAASCARIAQKTGRAPRHFAYPFGDAKAVRRRETNLVAGLPIATATTTRSGALRPEHADDLMALPRVTLNGFYQSLGYLDLAMSGLPDILSRS